MKKWILISFLVVWSEQQTQVTTCPMGTNVTQDNVSYAPACIATYEKIMSTDVKTKKEAEALATAMKTLGKKSVSIQEHK